MNETNDHHKYMPYVNNAKITVKWNGREHKTVYIQFKLNYVDDSRQIIA